MYVHTTPLQKQNPGHPPRGRHGAQLPLRAHQGRARESGHHLDCAGRGVAGGPFLFLHHQDQGPGRDGRNGGRAAAAAAIATAAILVKGRGGEYLLLDFCDVHTQQKSINPRNGTVLDAVRRRWSVDIFFFFWLSNAWLQASLVSFSASSCFANLLSLLRIHTT